MFIYLFIYLTQHGRNQIPKTQDRRPAGLRWVGEAQDSHQELCLLKDPP